MTIEQALENYRKGFPAIEIVSAATTDNGGIKRLSDEEQDDALGRTASFSGTLTKFVPASGAATRMFKDIFAAAQELEAVDRSGEGCYDHLSEVTSSTVVALAANSAKFPIDFPAEAGTGSSPIGRGAEIVRTLVESDRLDLASKPKGLIPFHRYRNAHSCESSCTCASGDSAHTGAEDMASASFTRTSFEEHLVEGALYAKDGEGVVRMEFTVSPEHIAGFRALFESVKDAYEKEYCCRYDVSFSVQSPETDVVAVDMDNRPFVKEDGELLLRPGGHGALIRNLGNVESDFVFLKNIDNVVKEERLPETVRWKKILLGRAVMLRERSRKALCDLVASLAAAHPGEACLTAQVSDCSCVAGRDVPVLSEAVAAARELLLEEFSVRIGETGSDEECARLLIDKLNRPIRVCGMVKNEGEPGGGPFVCRDRDGATSLQILESVQVDRTLYGDELRNSTHFNPVDLVCSLKDISGKRFELSRYTDPEAGFITVKSYKGREIKAQELPGLWNGAMSDWNTQFVEVPLSTFNPVKTFFDLLRPAHQ